MRKLVALGVICVPTIAAAHVRILSPTPRSSTNLKERHCGQTGSARANVSTLPPVSPLHLVWDEYINHPGWFRISFQQDGDTFEIPPASDGPTGSGAPSNYPTEDLTGMTDSGTGSLVIADRIVDGTLSLDFNLPNVECDNCTLQLIQLMTDKPPYTTDTASNDIYFACVDLVLTATAPDAAPAAPDAAPGQDAGNPAMGSSGGCSASGGGPSGILTALAMVGLLRRRRPRR
jgi:MYXO-CTERM domain-containing protein